MMKTPVILITNTRSTYGILLIVRPFVIIVISILSLIDVLLLADVFENFRKTCLRHYNLDPAHYYTSPGLAWDVCLKETGQELQLLHDYDQLMMFERGIRGGITHIAKRYAEANNKYMTNYDSSKPSTYIQYLDANNLYG